MVLVLVGAVMYARSRQYKYAFGSEYHEQINNESVAFDNPLYGDLPAKVSIWPTMVSLHRLPASFSARNGSSAERV